MPKRHICYWYLNTALSLWFINTARKDSEPDPTKYENRIIIISSLRTTLFFVLKDRVGGGTMCPDWGFFGNNSISHLFFKVSRWNLAERHDFMYEPKLYILIQEIFSTAHARARFLLLKNCYIQGNVNNNVNSSDIMTIFFVKVEFDSIKWNFKVILRLVRAFVHAHARIDKITHFFREKPSYLAFSK